MNTILDTHLRYILKLSEYKAKVLAKEVDMVTIGDLIYYFPYKHIDRIRIYKTVEINEFLPYIQLKGIIIATRIEGTGRKKRLIATFQDPYGQIDLIWFNRIDYFKNHLKQQHPYIIFGKPSKFGSRYSIIHPDIDDMNAPQTYAGSLYPVYSCTERMKKAGITSKVISHYVQEVLNSLSGRLTDTLPQYIVDHYHMLPLYEAIYNVHIPQNEDMLRRATTRLKAEEIFYIRLRMRYFMELRHQVTKGYLMKKLGNCFNDFFHDKLPFQLTDAQKRVVKEIFGDMSSGRQMNRLLQGDVGSGKTIVALLSLLIAIDNGYQTCMMAPTEILATQHYEGISEMVRDLPVRVELLVGSTSKKEKERISSDLINGDIDILIGTHALIEDYVKFSNLGLAVIDEQHRFGVYQRSVLWEKGGGVNPHILIMSATPIPRTLAMTLYGDLDVSVIDELPPGRTPIITRHVYENKRAELNFFIADQINEGRQIYVVYPLIKESESMDMKSLEEGYEQLKEAFSSRNIGIVHGQLKPAEKDAAMQLFVQGKTDILVSTTVIEVGVNVPNATVMLIESAERFGLSQLHQLRGRVGRGSNQSYCLLMTRHDLGEDARRRMGIMVETTNGFRIAEEDLKLRGYGDMDGTQQSGMGIDLKIANLSKDGRIVEFCAKLVDQILSEDPLLQAPKNEILKMHLHRQDKDNKDWRVIS